MNPYYIVIAVVVVVLIVIICIGWKQHESFRTRPDPQRIYGAKDVLTHPNSLKEFRRHVCSAKEPKCVDADDYMTARRLVNADQFTISEIEKNIV